LDPRRAREARGAGHRPAGAGPLRLRRDGRADDPRDDELRSGPDLGDAGRASMTVSPDTSDPLEAPPEANIRRRRWHVSVIWVVPGTGRPKTEFVGLDRPPPALERGGLKVILATAHLSSVRSGSPVYYRGIQVGAVTDTELSRDATAAHIHVFIGQRYARLVRVGSRFWSASGFDVNISLLKGVEVSLESLRSL